MGRFGRLQVGYRAYCLHDKAGRLTNHARTRAPYCYVILWWTYKHRMAITQRFRVCQRLSINYGCSDTSCHNAFVATSYLTLKCRLLPNVCRLSISHILNTTEYVVTYIRWLDQYVVL
jgi:hypothetical protein